MKSIAIICISLALVGCEYKPTNIENYNSVNGNNNETVVHDPLCPEHNVDFEACKDLH